MHIPPDIRSIQTQKNSQVRHQRLLVMNHRRQCQGARDLAPHNVTWGLRTGRHHPNPKGGELPVNLPPWPQILTENTAMNQGSIMPRETLRSRSRSRSPYRPSRLHSDHHDRPRLSRDRSRSPRRRHHHHHSRHDNKPSHTVTAPIKFPFKARNLSRHDLPTFRPMFALYLDVQKNILIEDLTEDEVKGRWKSFIGKW